MNVPARSPITTHVLDTARGVPARGVPVVLEHRESGDAFRRMGESVTDDDGRAADLLSPGTPLAAGVYRLTFDTGSYFAARGEAAFYPEVSVVFQIADDSTASAHYHVPLLLSPFSYSTYRGS